MKRKVFTVVYQKASGENHVTGLSRDGAADLCATLTTLKVKHWVVQPDKTKYDTQRSNQQSPSA